MTIIKSKSNENPRAVNYVRIRENNKYKINDSIVTMTKKESFGIKYLKTSVGNIYFVQMYDLLDNVFP